MKKIIVFKKILEVKIVLSNGNMIQCMYGGENEDVRKHFSKTLFSLASIQLCSVLSDLKVKMTAYTFQQTIWYEHRKVAPK